VWPSGFIDYSTGANIDGMIKAAQANVAAVTDKTIIIPGHGQPVSNKSADRISGHARRDTRECREENDCREANR
jgi:glyoxylase-like metal-dependent hydrolase (beta-lactamase superfamily II)